MTPGSSWSDAEGFQFVPFDYANRDEYIQGLLARHGTKLVRQYEKEMQALADFESFRTYFEGFLRAVPWPVRKWLKFRLVFRTRDARGEHNWLVDMGASKVEVIADASDDCVIIETPALVLNDCTKIWMFSVWTASKRLKIHLPSPAHLKTLRALFSLLDFYELETLPLRKNLTWRSLGVRLRRWREVVEAGRLFWKHVVLGHPFAIASLYAVPARVQTH
jgi:hypothetical protein